MDEPLFVEPAWAYCQQLVAIENDMDPNIVDVDEDEAVAQPQAANADVDPVPENADIAPLPAAGNLRAVQKLSTANRTAPCWNHFDLNTCIRKSTSRVHSKESKHSIFKSKSTSMHRSTRLLFEKPIAIA